MAVDYLLKNKASLQGSVTITGSPLATAGVIAASLLTTDKVTITNVPHLQDLDTLIQEIRRLGVMIDWTHAHEVTLQASQLSLPQDQQLDMVATWPASLLAAVIVRLKHLTISLDLYQSYPDAFLWSTLQRFGAHIEQQADKVAISLDHLHATEIDLKFQGAEQTLTAVILGSTAEGQTLLDGAVINPEMEDVIHCLRGMQADIERLDESRLAITGQELVGTTHRVLTDRYEAALWATLAITTAGDIKINNLKSALVLPFLAKLQQMGAAYSVNGHTIQVWRDTHHQHLQPITLQAKPFPGLANDWLLLLAPILTMVSGESLLQSDDPQELIEALEVLKDFGAEGRVDQAGVHFYGPTKLSGTPVQANAFHKGLVSLIAALGAHGPSTLTDIDSLDGRFESLTERLALLGARIERHER